jgi:hypothetical protein
MSATPSAAVDLDAFIARWKDSGGHERANYQLFLAELCDVLEVPRPDPAKPENALNAYVFERSVTRARPDGTATTNYLDLYKADHRQPTTDNRRFLSDCAGPPHCRGNSPPSARSSPTRRLRGIRRKSPPASDANPRGAKSRSPKSSQKVSR